MLDDSLEKYKKELDIAHKQIDNLKKLLIQKETELAQLSDVKTDFISLASHQLRTPITTINWYTEYLMNNDDSFTVEQRKDYLDQIYSSGRHMAELIDTLFMTSSLEMGIWSPTEEDIDVGNILKVIETNHKTLLNRQNITCKMTNTINRQLKTDEKMFRLIIQNLVSNAIKYTSKNETVTVTVGEIKEGKEFGDRKIKVDSVSIRVRDTGMGIPVDQHNHIFKRFFRADNAIDNKIQGVGLGLYIVKLLVHQLSGDIWFTSKEGSGTTFYVTIPLSMVT